MSEDRSSADHGASQENSIWRVMKAALFGDTSAESLRAQLEEAIDRHEDDPAPDAKGDLSPIERQMVRNLLHFGERDAGDVGVPRADIIAVEEQTSFAHLVQIFADAGHSRLPVYREELDTIIGMIHIKDVFAIMARGGDWPEGIAELIREPLYVPMSRGALDLLADPARAQAMGRAARARRRTVLRMRLLRQTCKEQHPEERCETEPSKGKAMHRNNWPDYCAAAVVKENS